MRRIDTRIQTMFKSARRSGLVRGLALCVVIGPLGGGPAAALAPDELEPNPEAMPTLVGALPFASYNNLTIHDATDEDWFRVSTPFSGMMITSARFIDDDGDVDMKVEDKDSNLLGVGQSTTDDERVAIPVVAWGDYRIRIFGFNMETNTYGLELQHVAAPVPDAAHISRQSDSGRSDHDGVTRDNTPLFELQADVRRFTDAGINLLASSDPSTTAGIQVVAQLTNLATGISQIASADPVGSADTLFTAQAALVADGDYLMASAVQVNDGTGAFSRGSLSPPTRLTIDTTPPVAPTPPAMLEISDSVNGMDGTTAAQTPTFTGMAEPNATVRLLANGLVVAEGLASPGGAYTLTAPAFSTPPVQTYMMTAEAEDAAGNISDESAATPVRILP